MGGRRAIASLVLGAALALGGRAVAGQCCGDCDGDGQVAISEVIAVVNNALNGCAGTPTPSPTVPPDGCPIHFGDDNTQPGTPDCYYRGRWNHACGASDLEALWRSDRSQPDVPVLIVTLSGFEPGLFLGAEITSERSAGLIGWYTQPDASDLEEANGEITLSTDGSRLEILTVPSPFSIETCAFQHYQGNLFAVDTPGEARAGAAAVLRDSGAVARLRGAAVARHIGPDLKRSESKKPID